MDVPEILRPRPRRSLHDCTIAMFSTAPSRSFNTQSKAPWTLSSQGQRKTRAVCRVVCVYLWCVCVLVTEVDLWGSAGWRRC